MRKIIGLTASALIVVIFTSPAFPAGCSGNACDVLSLQKKGGCLYAVNRSNRPVKFSHGVGHAPTVYAHSEEKILTLRGIANRTGECMTKIISWTANYAD